MTESDKVRAPLTAERLKELDEGGRLEWWPTKTQGTDVVLVTPDRRIENKGTLWIKLEEQYEGFAFTALSSPMWIKPENLQ